jgi:hypothetical protein
VQMLRLKLKLGDKLRKWSENSKGRMYLWRR